METTSDLFGTFLATLREEESSEVHPMRLVKELSDGPAPVDELWKRSGLALASFAETLTSAREARLIRVIHQGTNDVAELTDSGIELAKVVRSAVP